MGAGERARVVGIKLDERTVIRRNPDIEHERSVAIFDLLDENLFRLVARPEAGPFRLQLGIEDNRLIMTVESDGESVGTPNEQLDKVTLPLAALRKLIRDYFLVCENYYAAIRSATPSQIEAIDMGRRSLHNEGAEILRHRLADKVEIDHGTSRRLFTLICVLHIRG
ncbi:MAG TPA: UPF0262 family protein [Stellaceae bacterium]|nr:UPF0262 family protein [Stellaceae bacterium]